MQLAHKIELKTNNKQETYFKKACGTARFVWNWALSEWNKQFQTGGKPSGMKLKKEFNGIKEEQYPWTYEVTKYASQQPFLDLQDAWGRYFKKLAEKPKLKQKGKCRDSFYIGGDQIKVEGRRVWIPNLGWVKMREELRFPGKINSVVVSRTADRWFASIQVDTPIQFPQHENQMPVGIDVGINHLATLSTGVVFEAPKPLKGLLDRLKRRARKLSKKIAQAQHYSKSDTVEKTSDSKEQVVPLPKQKSSKNSQKQKVKLARLHAKIVNIRKDTLHKTTSWIAQFHSDVGLEDLNIQGMMKNRKLARSIADLGLYEFKRQLNYKLERRRGKVHFFDRFYPSSKKCSAPGCLLIKKELPLSERIYSCECGLILDRDQNASRNLNPIPGVNREYTPVEMAALKKQAGLVFSTSINEAGNQHHVA